MAYRDVILADAPVAYYRLGEASGTTAADERAVQAGTYVNVPTLAQSGALSGDANTAVAFDGTTQRVDVGDLKIAAQTDATVELWFKATDGGTNRWMFSEGSTLTDSPLFGVILEAGKVRVLWRNDANSVVNLYSPAATYNDVQWHHVVATKVGTALRLYVDGGEVVTGTTPGGAISLTTSTIAAVRRAAVSLWFPGYLDEVAVYNVALTAAKVAEHYQAGTTAPADTTPPSVPTGLTAAPGDAQVSLDWSDNVEGDLAGYRLYRDGVQVFDGAASTYLDSSAVNGTTYSYAVSAYDTSGNASAQSVAVQATPIAAATPPPDPPPDPPPTVPTGLAATVEPTSVTLGWDPNAEPDLAGYRLRRDAVEIYNGALTTFTDITAPAGEKVAYTVSAYDTLGNESEASAPVAVTTMNVRRRYAAGGLLSALSLDTPDGPVTLLAPGSRGVSNAEGFAGMATRVITTARAGRHGSVNRTRHRQDRQITWEGTLQSTDNNPDRVWWEYQQIARALASAQDEDRELHYTLGEGLPLFARVRLEELSAPIEVGPNAIKYQATMRAQDPRGYSAVEHVQQTGPLFREAQPTVADFPLVWPVTFPPLTTGRLNVHNDGTVGSPPTIELDGWLRDPVVQLGDRRLVFVGEIAEGDTLTIDTDERTVMLNGTANRRGLLDSVRSRWFELPPYPAVIELLPQAFAGAGGLRVRFRDAIQ